MRFENPSYDFVCIFILGWVYARTREDTVTLLVSIFFLGGALVVFPYADELATTPVYSGIPESRRCPNGLEECS